MKKFIHCEVLCIGWNSGSGKYTNSLVTWRAKITQVSIETISYDSKQHKLKLGAEFNVTPNATDEQKKEWFDKFTSDPVSFAEYKNKYMTIQFLGITEEGIPSHANALVFRDDIEFDQPKVDEIPLDEI
jgi:hypothetical protein